MFAFSPARPAYGFFLGSTGKLLKARLFSFFLGFFFDIAIRDELWGSRMTPSSFGAACKRRLWHSVSFVITLSRTSASSTPSTMLGMFLIWPNNSRHFAALPRGSLAFRGRSWIVTVPSSAWFVWSSAWASITRGYRLPITLCACVI